MLSFSWPWLFALLPLPWLVWRLVPPAKQSQSALHSPLFALLHQPERKQPGLVSGSRKRLLLTAAVWLLLLSAAARPVWLGEPQPLPQQGRDLMLALDLSASMEEKDMAAGQGRYVDRLRASKAVLSDFIRQRSGDRLGLILFADAAYLQTPLTYDLVTVQQMLDEAVFGLVGRKTAIGDAIGLAIKRLASNQNPDKVLILLTDGQNTAGQVTPLDAGRLAAEQGIRIYTIGLGADEIMQQTIFGPRRVNPSQDLDEPTLQQIAQLTGARYFRARDPQQLSEIYQLLDQLEPADYDAATMRPEQSLFHWPLALALLLSVVAALQRLVITSDSSVIPETSAHAVHSATAVTARDARRSGARL